MGVLEVFQGSDRQWYWRVKAANYRIVAQSEGYKDKRGALRGITALGNALGVSLQGWEIDISPLRS